MAEKVVYVIGASPELLSIDKSYFDNKITIGVNSTYLFKDDMDYFIAGHPVWAVLWEYHANPKQYCVYHGVDIGRLNKTRYRNSRAITTSDNIHRYWDSHYLVGIDMCGFSATHFAYKLSATSIVYVGFNGKTGHFFDQEPYRELLRQHLLHCARLRPDVEEIERFYEHFYPVKQQSATSVMVKNYEKYKKNYSLIFNHLSSRGVGVYCTEKDSVVHEAGAKHLPI